MTISDFWDHNGSGIIIAAIGAFFAAIPGTIAAVGTFINGRRAMVTRGIVQESRDASQHGVEVSTRNAAAIQAVRHDLQNGVGEKIAARAVEHIRPALVIAATEAGSGLKEVAIEVADKLVQTADDVAVALAEKTKWDGQDRGLGPADRREEKGPRR